MACCAAGGGRGATAATGRIDASTDAVDQEKKKGGGAQPEGEADAMESSNPILRTLNQVLDFVNGTAFQTFLYCAFVYVFQTLTETLRHPKLEYYFDKMIADTFLENHFDSSHNAFDDIRRVADIWEWGNNVLWPGFFANGGPCTGDVGDLHGIKLCNDDAWPDGEGSFHLDGSTPYTIPELVRNMDLMDWTDGVIIKSARVAGTDPKACHTHQLAGECYPELKPFGKGDEDRRSYGYNWTEPNARPIHPWRFWSAEELGSDPQGQVSAAIPSMRVQPGGGFVAVIIPFFSRTWLDEERGRCDPAFGEVVWYKDYYVNTTSANKQAFFYCLRLSWNGEECHQLCDPTDIGVVNQTATGAGRNTGVVRVHIERFWNDLKRAHFVDAYTRVMTLVLQLKSNHIGIRYRTTLMFETTSLGAVLPSYDVETRVEDGERLDMQSGFLNVAVGMCMFFVALEGIAIIQDGPTSYFGDLWNLMDWLNFAIFFLVWVNILRLNTRAANRECARLCREVGYQDDWLVMNTARTVKVYLSACVCIQLLKIIKFTNVLIPKMALMTAVLSKGKMDLLFFGLVFGISMMAFSMMFYVQLGPVMEDFNDQIASFLSLARALFGDFDIDEIMNNSRGYLNAILMLVYLFVAVFILLSMFLAILGESQAAVRNDQDDDKADGTAPPEYGVFFHAGQGLRWTKNTLVGRFTNKCSYATDVAAGADGEEVTSEEHVAPVAAQGASGGTESRVKPGLASQLRQMLDEVGEVRGLVGELATQVKAARARPVGAAAADALALYKVVARVEQSLGQQFAQLEERAGRFTEKKKKLKSATKPLSAAEGGTAAVHRGANVSDAAKGDHRC